MEIRDQERRMSHLWGGISGKESVVPIPSHASPLHPGALPLRVLSGCAAQLLEWGLTEHLS